MGNTVEGFHDSDCLVESIPLASDVGYLLLRAHAVSRWTEGTLCKIRGFIWKTPLAQ